MKRYYFENMVLCGYCNGSGLRDYMDYCRCCNGTGLETFNEFASHQKGDLITLRFDYHESIREITGRASKAEQDADHYRNMFDTKSDYFS